MQPLIAYALTLLTIPIVGLLAFFITMPLLTTVTATSAKFYNFSSHALANAARCAAAWAVFYWLGVPFGIEPILLICVLMAVVNVARLKQDLNVYACRLDEAGLHTGSDAAAIHTVRLEDDKFRAAHSDVGDSIAGLVGCLAGVAISIAVWIQI